MRRCHELHRPEHLAPGHPDCVVEHPGRVVLVHGDMDLEGEGMTLITLVPLIIDTLEYYADMTRWGTTHTGNVYDERVCLPSPDREKDLLAVIKRDVKS